MRFQVFVPDAADITWDLREKHIKGKLFNLQYYWLFHKRRHKFFLRQTWDWILQY